jgi:hypothetical protein
LQRPSRSEAPLPNRVERFSQAEAPTYDPSVMHARRFFVLLAFAIWFGGLSFYSVVVIPTAHSVLRSHLRVGFITQGVTHWINATGAAVLALLMWDYLASRKEGTRRLRLSTWGVMVIAQATLLALHPILDSRLDATSKDIVEPDRFYELHRVYLLVTTAQWAAALPHLWTVLREWASKDEPPSWKR